MEVGRSRGRNGDQERAGHVVGGTALVPEQGSLPGDDGTDLAYQAAPIWTEQQVDLTFEPAPVGGSSQIRRVLEIAGLSQAFCLDDDEESAHRLISAGSAGL
jgi:hypothetical protein